VQLTTLAACGDVQRNVMGCPAPYKHPIYQQVQELVDRSGQYFTPRTPAYHELWIQDSGTGNANWQAGGRRMRTRSNRFTARRTLPRKFKMAVGFASDNCVDIYTHDLGFLAVVRDGAVVATTCWPAAARE